MNTSELNISADVETIARIPVVPAILEVICRTTGMGFAAIARVTEERWVACAVRDEIRFGLMPGGELKLDTTICYEIRQTGDPVVIDHVREDETYHNHHTPVMYGFQSYISVPIVQQDGRFFGTLCAIDPKPSILNNTEIVGMFKTYASLISFYLAAAERTDTPGIKAIEDHIIAELKALLNSVSGYSLHGQDAADPNQAQQSVNKNDGQFSVIVRDSAQKIQSLINDLNTTLGKQ